jgi:hypothetical protein
MSIIPCSHMNRLEPVVNKKRTGEWQGQSLDEQTMCGFSVVVMMDWPIKVRSYWTMENIIYSLPLSEETGLLIIKH